MAPYTNLGNMIKEFGPEKGGNAQPAENYEDQKKKDFLEAEKENLDLYPSYRVYKVDKKDGHIHAVYAKHIESGEIAVVMVGEEEATCKKVVRHSDGIVLISNNPKYEPMFFTSKETEELPVRIIGKVIELRVRF